MSNNRVALNVRGMHCMSCAKLVERALKAQKGVHNATVVLVKQQAIVEYDPQQVTLETLKQAIVAQGYSVGEAVAVADAVAA